MKSAKAFAILVCAGLLSITAVGSSRHAYAQENDGADDNTGFWIAGPSGSAPDEDSSPDSKKPPLDVSGCWGGTNIDKNPELGNGVENFNEFVQDGKKLESTSHFFFFWNAGAEEVAGTLTGTVSSTGITFKGSAGKDCTITGSAEGSDTAMVGKFKFSGKCKKEFEKGSFSIQDFCD